MTINQISENIYESVIDGSLNNADLVQIIELCGSYLNLKTISQYAADEGKSYNGVKHNRDIVKLFGVKFVIENH